MPLVYVYISFGSKIPNFQCFSYVFSEAKPGLNHHGLRSPLRWKGTLDKESRLKGTVQTTPEEGTAALLCGGKPLVVVRWPGGSREYEHFGCESLGCKSSGISNGNGSEMNDPVFRYIEYLTNLILSSYSVITNNNHYKLTTRQR